MNKFMLIVTNRIAAHKDAEAKRLEVEREKIRREEEAKARAEAERIAQAERDRIRAEEQAKALEASAAERIRLRAEAEAREQAMQADAAEIKAMAGALPEPTPQFAQQQADTGAKITLGQINQRLSPIALSVAGLAQLGIQPAGKERAAVLYLESDVARICSVLIRHLTTVARGEIKEVA